MKVARSFSRIHAFSTVTGSWEPEFGRGAAAAQAAMNCTMPLKPFGRTAHLADRSLQIAAKLAQVERLSAASCKRPGYRRGGGGRAGQTPAVIKHRMLGDDSTTPYMGQQAIAGRAQDMPELTDVDSDLQPRRLEARFDRRRDALPVRA